MHLAIVGLLIQTVYFGLSYIAFKAGVSAGGVAIIVCLQPILVGLIAPRFAGETVGALRWVGWCWALRVPRPSSSPIGDRRAAPLGHRRRGGRAHRHHHRYLWEKRFGKTHHPVASNTVQYVAGLAGILPLALAFESFSFDWNLPFVAALAYLVIGNSIIAMTLLLAMIRAGEVARVSSLFYLVPPISALIAWPLLGEAMPLLGWAGFALAALGVAIASRQMKPK